MDIMRIRNRRNLKTTAIRPQHNDVYLVEFPKSGITWLSCLLANAALAESGRPEIASFTAAHQFIPDIHITRQIASLPYDKPPVRMIKSHATYNPNYIFVIYLVRHPLSVMKSYFRFSKQTNGVSQSNFDKFCRSKKNGVPAWKRHINSWLLSKNMGQRIHLIKYEDLLICPKQELNMISKNFGWNLRDSSIEKSVLLSCKEQMSDSEETYRSRNPRYRMKFVGGGDDFDVSMTTRTFIEDQCQSELQLLGYAK